MPCLFTVKFLSSSDGQTCDDHKSALVMASNTDGYRQMNTDVSSSSSHDSRDHMTAVDLKKDTCEFCGKVSWPISCPVTDAMPASTHTEDETASFMVKMMSMQFSQDE